MTTTHRQPHMVLLLTASFILFTGSFILDQAFRWTDPMEGIASGVFHVFFTGIAWLFYGLIPGLLISGLYRWRGWQRLRTCAIVAPGIVAISFVVIGLIFAPTTPARRLRQFAHADLPAAVTELRTHFTGGGIADFTDTYYFRCSPTETDRLIRALNLKPSDQFDEQFFDCAPFRSLPDPSTWPHSTLYRGGRDDGGWFYYLRTDATREQVYLLIACI